MASSLIVQVDNLRKETVKTTPMMTLGQVLEEVCARSKGKLDPKAHKLLHNRKPVDLTSPLRFANIPSGTKLELQRDPSAPAAAAPVPAARPAPPPSGGGGGGAPSSSGGGRRLGLHTGEPDKPSVAGPPPSKGGPQVAGRDVVVYSEEALLASRGGMDVPDDDSFYEFTPEDYARVMAGHKEAVAREERGLLTKKLREQDLVKKAEAVGTVRIRVCFPDGLIVETGFGALEKVGALHDFARACSAPPPGAGVQLFTTPPKVVLKDKEATVYQAGLAPAANVRLSWTGEAPAGPSLRPEVLALQGPPPEQPSRGGGGQADSPPRERFGGAAVPGAGGEEEQPRKSLKEGGKPKWLKM